MKNYPIILLLVTLLFCSCKKEEVADPIEYLMFGYVPGWCIPDTSSYLKYYKLENDQLFENDNSTCFPDQVTFLSTPMSTTNYDLAKDLLNTIPDDLLLTTQSYLGCPNCGDQGTIYVELKANGQVRSWSLDPYGDFQPQTIVDYMEEVWDVWDLLY